MTLLFPGCVSNRYRMVNARNALPPAPIERVFPSGPLQGTLQTLITYHGPGSWKRDALWDEYVITCTNAGSEPVVLTGAVLLDEAGQPVEPGADPWLLEKQSMTREDEYKAAGVAFVRYTAPGVLIVGTGAALVAAAPLTAGAATAAAATIVVLPIYYLAVLGINHDNKEDVLREFDRRRLQPQLQFGPGGTITGSCFFPMVVSPRALKLAWRRGQETGESVLTLDFLRGLHLAEPAKQGKA